MSFFFINYLLFFCRVVLITDGHDSQAAGIRGSADPGSDGGAAGHMPGHGEEGTGEASFNKTPNVYIKMHSCSANIYGLALTFTIFDLSAIVWFFCLTR